MGYWTFGGTPYFDELQRESDREQRRIDSVERFLMTHVQCRCFFLCQTFKTDFSRNDERSARSRLAPVKKKLREHGEILVVWERTPIQYLIHAHIIFAMDPDRPIDIKRELKPVSNTYAGILLYKDIRSMRYRAISRYLASYVSKDLKYRFTASVSLRSLPPKRWLSRQLGCGVWGAGNISLYSPRPTTCERAEYDFDTGIFWHYCSDSVQERMRL